MTAALVIRKLNFVLRLAMQSIKWLLDIQICLSGTMCACVNVPLRMFVSSCDSLIICIRGRSMVFRNV